MRRQASYNGRSGCIDTVSNGATPIAFSISNEFVTDLLESILRRCDWLTSQVIQLELIDTVHRFRVLPVILNEVEIIRGCEQARKC